MIKLKRLNGEEIILNSDLIELVKATPDTVIKLTNNKTIIVQESVDDVVQKVIEFRRKINTSVVVDKE